MTDMSRAMPPESQWDLLDEYGLNGRFDVVWIERRNRDWFAASRVLYRIPTDAWSR
ncbi:hypothetical protein HNP84_002028 [Thermocatellispora tengchongensis]|uniref:Uncharacterized protein n=1 Tax=Thermocatellispora tengchongensis TaxID=1073253 RepID=A0A840NYS0_9ACTN|nr:hypothetical protein [Thermocatellispora tengchongensis]